VAVLATAEHDPFREEAVAYATWRRAAGLWKSERNEPSLTHNFLLLDRCRRRARAAGDRIAHDRFAVRRLTAAALPGVAWTRLDR
jgi:acetyl esterase/lipase